MSKVLAIIFGATLFFGMSEAKAERRLLHLKSYKSKGYYYVTTDSEPKTYSCVNKIKGKRSYILQKARNLVGKSSRNEIGGGRKSCAVMVSKVIPDENVKSPSTKEMFKKLKSSPSWESVSVYDAEPGDIIISPSTGKKVGHVGVIGEDGKIYQNKSTKKMFLKTEVTVFDWVRKYSKRSLPTYVFRYS
jgi:hypothetical protein